MRRGVITFFLMLCMCLNALASTAAALLASDGAEQDHAVMHLEGQAHHHDDHDDGDGPHEDQSVASAQHIAGDGAVHAPVLMTHVDLSLPPLPPEMPVLATATHPPPPFLAGPERPPRDLS